MDNFRVSQYAHMSKFSHLNLDKDESVLDVPLSKLFEAPLDAILRLGYLLESTSPQTLLRRSGGDGTILSLLRLFQVVLARMRADLIDVRDHVEDTRKDFEDIQVLWVNLFKFSPLKHS